MKTAKTTYAAACDPFGADHQTTPRGPEASALVSRLRKAVAQAAEWVTGTDPDLARTHFLSQAIYTADLKRRIAAWDAMQETRRALPPVF